MPTRLLTARIGSTNLPSVANQLWPEVIDADYVERLILAIQRAAGEASGPALAPNGMVAVSAPDLANALLLILANILDDSPAAATPAGMRRLAEATGKVLHQMMKDARRAKLGDGSA